MHKRVNYDVTDILQGKLCSCLPHFDPLGPHFT